MILSQTLKHRQVNWHVQGQIADTLKNFMIIYKDDLPPTSMILIFMNNIYVSYMVMWYYNTPNNPFNQPHTQGQNPICSIFDICAHLSSV